MKKLIVFTLLALLCIANACLDYTAFCTFLDVDPFPLFEDFGGEGGNAGNQTIAIIIALAQALLLIALPSVAARKLAAGDKASCVVALALAGVVAVLAAALRAVTESGSAGSSIDGSAMGIPPALVCFCGIMLIAAVGEAVLSFLYETMQLKQTANGLRAKAERIALMEEAIADHVAAATDIAVAAAKKSASAASAGNEAVFQELLRKAGQYQNAFIGYAGAIESTRAAQQAAADEALENFEARLEAIRDSYLAKLQSPHKSAARQIGE